MLRKVAALPMPARSAERWQLQNRAALKTDNAEVSLEIEGGRPGWGCDPDKATALNSLSPSRVACGARVFLQLALQRAFALLSLLTGGSTEIRLKYARCRLTTILL